MAKKDKNINKVNEESKLLKDTFSEIGSLINELNASLAKTVTLTEETGYLSKEFMNSEVNLKGLKETLAGLDEEKQNRLEGALKTGKGLTHELTKELGLQKHIGKLSGAAGKTKIEHLKELIKKGEEKAAQDLKELKTKARNAQVMKAANAAMDVMLTAIMAADKETTEMARSLNLSKTEATGLKQQFAQISLDTGDIAINSIRLGKANAGLNAQLGTGVVFSGEMLTTFSKLTEIVGISGEAAGSLAFQGQLAGQSFREVEENVLGASYSMQRGVGIQLNMKDVLEATGKVTGQVRANLGANPELIAKAVTAAKLLGAELGDIVAAGRSMLSFESSIEAELEAELLTGKQLNLERARAAALAGDQVALAEELSQNVGTHAEFTNMNVLQQDALAKAMGMSADSMADMLLKQETMGMNAKQLRAQGKGELADKLEQLSLQDKITLAQEKFQAIVGDLSTIFMPVLDGFGNLVSLIMESKGAMIGLVIVMGSLAVLSVISSIAKMWGTLVGTMGPVGVGIAVGATVLMMAGIAAAASSMSSVKDGYAPSSRGPFTISDNYGAMARTTPGDNLQVGPGSGGGASAQPVVIQNNWDAFAASNGNGRRGLGGTQALQASPTFA